MMLFTQQAAAAGGLQYATMADLREETKNGWHQNYTYKGETIQIDADIVVPDVDAVPIIRIMVASDIDYTMNFYPAIRDKVLVSDAPLLSFAPVKAAYEKLIETGYIRNIFDISLEYTVMANPDDLGNTYLLIPVWIASGIVVQNPAHKTPTYTDEEMVRFRENRHHTALTNAQTGVHISPHDKSKTRWQAAYLTWDEVH